MVGGSSVSAAFIFDAWRQCLAARHNYEHISRDIPDSGNHLHAGRLVRERVLRGGRRRAPRDVRQRGVGRPEQVPSVAQAPPEQCVRCVQHPVAAQAPQRQVAVPRYLRAFLCSSERGVFPAGMGGDAVERKCCPCAPAAGGSTALVQNPRIW